MSVTEISAQELGKLARERSIDLIDVRTPAEFEEVHASIAKSVPLDRVTPDAIAPLRQGHPNEPLYLICKSGTRGRMACEKLIAAGLANVVNVIGGTQAWEQAGLDVTRGRKTMSLERQVRCIAGVLILLGTSLGYFVHPAWLILPLICGIGMLHAGITDSCLMGLMLVKLPWNQRGGSTPAACPVIPKA